MDNQEMTVKQAGKVEVDNKSKHNSDSDIRGDDEPTTKEHFNINMKWKKRICSTR